MMSGQIPQTAGASYADFFGGSVQVVEWWDGDGVAQPLHALRDDLVRILARTDGPDVPVLGTGAGHDAGILANAGVPTAMLFVRNPTGISHSPEEFATSEDCLAGVEALTTVLLDLAGGAS